MDAGPGTGLGALGCFSGVWAVMMAGTMLPSLAPTAATYVKLTRRREPNPPAPLAGGYLLAPSVAGGAAYGFSALGKSSSALSWHTGGRWLSTGVPATAAL